MSVNLALSILQSRTYHKIIAVFQGDGSIEVSEEDELRVLERRVHRRKVGGSHLAQM